VAPGRIHEELERVERARRRRRRLRRRDGGADDDVALVERGVQRGELVIGQLVLVRERLELPLLDEAAVGGLLDQALGRRQIMQMRVSQWNLPLSSVVGLTALGPLRAPTRVLARQIAGRPLVPLFIERLGARVHS
jgi:hypothetical protein